ADLLPHHHGEVIDLGDVIVLPGLINAHCHLEYGLLRGVILPSRNFPQWIERIKALKRSLTDADYVTGIESGFQELRHYGVTTVLNILSAPPLMPLFFLPKILSLFLLQLIF